MESKTLDVAYCIQFLQETKLNISNLRENFDDLFNETSKLEGIISSFRVRHGIKEKTEYKTCFFEIIDIIVEQIDTRFADLKEY